jgi:hypothetical protein
MKNFVICTLPKISWKRGSAGGIATGYGLVDRGVRVRVSVGLRIFTSSYRRGRLWGTPNLLSNGYFGFFPGGGGGGKAAGA